MGASMPATPAATYNMANMPAADTNAFNGTTALQGNTTNNVNSLYDSGAATSMGSALTNAAATPLGYQGQALANGFDPQSALYAQSYQQQQDQTNVTNAQNGVAGTPYGAAVAANADTNFNIDWQNAQLGRQATAASTASTLGSTASTEATSGTALGQSVPQFSTAEQQQTIQDYLSYLTGGVSAENATTSQYSAEAQAALGQNAQTMAGLGGIGQLGGTLGMMALL